MGRAIISTEQWPIVVVSMPESMSLEELADYWNALEAILRSGHESFALIIDHGEARAPMGSRQRDLSQARRTELELFLVARLSCEAHILPNTVLRSTLAAVSWLRRPVVPSRTFANMSAAARWATEQVAATRNYEASSAVG